MGKKRGGGGREFWDGLSGWKSVQVGDDLLLGSDEYGFCGLEELDASALGALIVSGGGEQPAADEAQAGDGGGAGAAEKQKGKKRKAADAAAAAAAAGPAAKSAAGKAIKQGKKGQQDVAAEEEGAAAEEGGEAAAAGDEQSVAALKQQLAALQAENKQLKKQKKKEEKVAKRAAAAAQKKEERQARRAAAAAAAAEAAAATEAAAAVVDVSAWKELQLHPQIEAAIARLGFSAPTHVQAECLPAAIRDRRDVIGAAQTGSGKTLAFGLPIMQLLLQERDQSDAAGAAGAAQQEGDGGEGEGGAAVAAGGSGGGREASPLRALILAPTRELAMQVCEHLQAVGKPCGIWVVPIVGGISALKQERLLSKHPEVIVATPGRLWDLMRDGQAHVTRLDRLSFLVIDEADRMVQQGHYGELSSILGAIPAQQALAAPEGAEAADEPAEREPVQRLRAAGDDSDEDAEEEGEEEEEEGDAEEGGESEQEEEGEEAAGEGQAGAASPAAQQAQEQQGQQQQRGGGRPPRPHRMQTFVFSATLTLPANLRRRLRKGGGGASGSSDLDALMDKIPFRGKPKIVDLTSARRLAERVTEAYVACGEAQRDEVLYCLLAKHPGRTIVFVNAISAVRRLAAILKLLGLPAQPLHAGMQQRQRLKALDRFKADDNAILVATDVAARGLDIKDVRCVVHYQLPASVDVYVHRSGRTARAEAEGVAIALVTPKENARFLALLRAMKREEPPEFPLDATLLPAVHARVRLAVRLDELERKQSKAKADKSWRQTHAEQLGIELSSDDEDDEGGSGRRQGKKAKREAAGKRGPEDAETAADVRSQLAALLAEPLQPKFSRKWFTGGAAAAVMAAVDPSAPAAAGGKKRKKAAAAEQAAAAGEEAAPVPEPRTVQTVNQAVALAQQQADSRSRAAGAAGTAGGKQKQQQKKAGKKKAQDPRAAALQAALNKALTAKQRKKAGGRGMTVVATALGRESGGPDALQALRQKLGGR
ncbi:DEAD-box ATP-dependent RNA helicase 13 isoform A [Chlorella sorokiniana]|uniref:ATP-dependent RNA helicase n=1 Tax=Chlorella sorokiniana TaxID=3076 RepID=A0A2P6TZF3_CHLSO|nr:DEAD-box ATP-dependent RNA helicase 13 isoform A [Chlorella sorokiniana]|eukprot:PRW59446.1 DEAD-box ATP-dependent RNA helicase 13 isoform A [Chlorella sorokiniana]